MPSQLEALRKLIRILESAEIDYMMIGGWALPAYGHVRSTLDLDLAIAVKHSENLKRLISALRAHNYQMTYDPKLDHAVIPLLDKENMVEIELWQKPDGLNIDAEVLRRRWNRQVQDISFWIVGPEDFIVNKLSIPKRSAIDEQDVVTVLKRQKGRLDSNYLKNRAKQAGVESLLEALESRIEELS